MLCWVYCNYLPGSWIYFFKINKIVMNCWVNCQNLFQRISP